MITININSDKEIKTHYKQQSAGDIPSPLNIHLDNASVTTDELPSPQSINATAAESAVPSPLNSNLDNRDEAPAPPGWKGNRSIQNDNNAIPTPLNIQLDNHLKVGSEVPGPLDITLPKTSTKTVRPPVKTARKKIRKK